MEIEIENVQLLTLNYLLKIQEEKEKEGEKGLSKSRRKEDKERERAEHCQQRKELQNLLAKKKFGNNFTENFCLLRESNNVLGASPGSMGCNSSSWNGAE